MKPTALRWTAVELLAAASPLLVTADAAIRESYHRVSTEATLLTVSFSVALLALMLTALAGTLCRSGEAVAWWRRLPPAVALAYTLQALGAAVLASGRVQGGAPWGTLAALAIVALLLAAAARGEALWRRACAGAITAATLFVASQPLLAVLQARPVAWPADSFAADAVADRGRRVTIMLLLDELNAVQSQPLIDELQAAGLVVSFKAVPSIGASTANVVPGLFGGQTFIEARPCAPTTICGRVGVLDFARITASRSDIDVVGFFHPYCAIRGLRSCQRFPAQLAVVNPDRWRCALNRRIPQALQVRVASCASVSVNAWVDLVDALLPAVRAAPALHSGGVLFAHVPLPHPPARTPVPDLAADYLFNLERARLLLRDLIATARASGLQMRFIVFSDHPLRQEFWCQYFDPYRQAGCRPDPRMQDRLVPLIAAGETAPDLSSYDSNQNVFKLVSAWRNDGTAR